MAEGDARAAAFECSVCLDTASEPVVTRCGHLFWCAPRLHHTQTPAQNHIIKRSPAAQLTFHACIPGCARCFNALLHDPARRHVTDALQLVLPARGVCAARAPS